MSAILQSESGCPSHWLPYLSHRDCNARSHLERLNYLLHNPAMTAEIYYVPLLREWLQSWSGQAMTLALDTSLYWDEYCLIEVCLVWGGRSIVLAQQVLEHGSATVGFSDYRPVLEAVVALLPQNGKIHLLADRGFEHGELMRWLQKAGWDWSIRAKTDLKITLNNGLQRSVSELLAAPESAHLYPDVNILGNVRCHLATAHWSHAKEAWAVLSSRPPSLQTFAEYGQRFGGIEPHFKDYKSAAFGLTRSRIRHAQALNCLFMLIATAQLWAIQIGFQVAYLQRFVQSDWHGQRGISFLQLGLRELKRCIYCNISIPGFKPLPYVNPPPAVASRKKKAQLDNRIEFSRVQVFSF